MRIYVATRFDLWQLAQIAHEKIADAGHVPTGRWVRMARDLAGDCNAVPVGDDRRKANACIDLEDIEFSDALILIVPSTGGTGCWYELGFAEASGLRTMIVGDRSRTVFLELHECYETIDDAIAAL